MSAQPDDLVERLRASADFRERERRPATATLLRDAASRIERDAATIASRDAEIARKDRVIADLIAWASTSHWGRKQTGAPNHAHEVPGIIWDDDIGNRQCGLAGKPCEDCATWDRARAEARAAIPSPDGAAG